MTSDLYLLEYEIAEEADKISHRVCSNCVCAVRPPLTKLMRMVHGLIEEVKTQRRQLLHRDVLEHDNTFERVPSNMYK